MSQEKSNNPLPSPKEKPLSPQSKFHKGISSIKARIRSSQANMPKASLPTRPQPAHLRNSISLPQEGEIHELEVPNQFTPYLEVYQDTVPANSEDLSPLKRNPVTIADFSSCLGSGSVTSGNDRQRAQAARDHGVPLTGQPQGRQEEPAQSEQTFSNEQASRPTSSSQFTAQPPPATLEEAEAQAQAEEEKAGAIAQLEPLTRVHARTGE